MCPSFSALHIFRVCISVIDFRCKNTQKTTNQIELVGAHMIRDVTHPKVSLEGLSSPRLTQHFAARCHHLCWTSLCPCTLNQMVCRSGLTEDFHMAISITLSAILLLSIEASPIIAASNLTQRSHWKSRLEIAGAVDDCASLGETPLKTGVESGLSAPPPEHHWRASRTTRHFARISAGRQG